MSVLANKRLLVGRRIADYDPRVFEDRDSASRLIKLTYRPRITLDNGAQLVFVVDEVDSGDVYGVRPIYIARAKGG